MNYIQYFSYVRKLFSTSSNIFNKDIQLFILKASFHPQIGCLDRVDPKQQSIEFNLNLKSSKWGAQYGRPRAQTKYLQFLIYFFTSPRGAPTKGGHKYSFHFKFYSKTMPLTFIHELLHQPLTIRFSNICYFKNLTLK